MELIYSRREKIVGLFVISIIVLLFSTVVLIGRGKNWFKSYVTYYTVFEESYNLQENADVKFQKASIGKVSRIDLTEDKVRVTLKILEDYQSRITRDTAVTVKSPTFIGDEYVAVIPGNPRAPAMDEGEEIKSIPKKSIEDLLVEFQVEQTAKKLSTAVKNISDITEALRDPEGPLFTAFEELEAILSNLADATAKTPMVMDHVNTNLVTINKIGNELYFNLTDLRNMLADVAASLQRVKTALANVEEASYDIPAITHSTSLGIDEIRGAVESTDRIIQSLKENFLIKGNLPPTPEGANIDAGPRQ
ncbi:MAG: MlaD family protein [Thermodesulfobacteriota bacterium]|nr:MlaD family protein [Thermodesulfobacteriota bacterium]